MFGQVIAGRFCVFGGAIWHCPRYSVGKGAPLTLARKPLIWPLPIRSTAGSMRCGRTKLLFAGETWSTGATAMESICSLTMYQASPAADWPQIHAWRSAKLATFGAVVGSEP